MNCAIFIRNFCSLCEHLLTYPIFAFAFLAVKALQRRVVSRTFMQRRIAGNSQLGKRKTRSRRKKKKKTVKVERERGNTGEQVTDRIVRTSVILMKAIRTTSKQKRRKRRQKSKYIVQYSFTTAYAGRNRTNPHTTVPNGNKPFKIRQNSLKLQETSRDQVEAF